MENDTTVRLFQQMLMGPIDLVMGEQEVLKSAVAQLPPGDQAGLLPVEASPVPLLPNGLIVSKDYPGGAGNSGPAE